MPIEGTWPSVAVIVPNVQRVEETLLAVRSALEQDYPGRLRTYLVYERRPDEATLLEGLPSEVEAIGVTSPPDSNPIAFKRNLALATCDEDLVGFLDDDDIWHPQKVRRQVEAMRAVAGAVGSSTGFVRFRDGLTWEEPDHRRPVIVSRSAVLRASTIVTSSMLAGGSLLRELRFDERPEWFAVEDFHLWNRLRQRGPIAHVPASLVGIRVGRSTMSRQSRSWQHVKALAVLAELAGGSRDWEVVRAAAVVAATAGLSARGTVDPRADAMLDSFLDGRLFGRFDRVTAAAIRSVWRSRYLVPALGAARARVLGRSEEGEPLRRRGSGPGPSRGTRPHRP